MQDWDKDNGGEITEIKKQFDMAFNGQMNFMTPHAIKYFRHKELLGEVSEGEFMKKKLYGITFLKMVKEGDNWIPRRTKNINRCCNSLEEARDWFMEWSKRIEAIEVE